MTGADEPRAWGKLLRLLGPHGRNLWTAALVLPLVEPKLRHAAGMHEYGTDGGHYVDVARHLAEGDGFTTSLSVLHQGLPSFPYPSSIYPVWPMVMAALLQVFSLRFVTAFVPAILFFAVLLLADRVGRRLSPAPWARPLAGLDGGHALLICFAAAAQFFQFTSRPYTEALSFTLALLFLLRAHHLFRSLGVRAGIELGLWMALLFYCRSHFVIFGLGLLAAFALEALLRVRRRDAELAPLVHAAAASALSAALAWLPMYLWLASSLENPGLGAYFRFDRARATPYLSEILPREPLALKAVLLDRLQGGLRAYDPRWRFSYYRNFGPVTYALPLALVALAAAPRAARAKLSSLLAQPGARLLPVYTAIVALGGMLSIHLVHKKFSYEWYFQSRHATICAFAFFGAAMIALRCPRRMIAALAAMLLLAGVAVGYARAYERARRPIAVHPTVEPMIAWMKELRGEKVVIAADSVVMRRVMWQAPTELRRRIGVHTTYERTKLADLRALSDELGVRYFVVQDGSKRAKQLRKATDFRLLDEIAVPRWKPSQLLVFTREPSAARAAD